MRRRTIHSPQNARIKAAARLRRGAHRARQGKTLIDGIRELNRALDAGVAIEEAFYCPDSGEIEQIGELLRRLDSTRCEVFPVRPEVLAKLAYGQRAEGPVGVAVPPQTRLHDLQLPPNPLVAVLEGVEKPGNLGAIIRTAEAAGLAAVVVADPRTDLYNPNPCQPGNGIPHAAVHRQDGRTAALAPSRRHADLCGPRRRPAALHRAGFQRAHRPAAGR